MSGLPYGLQAMLKEGHKHLSGLEEAVLKNIEACKQLSQMTRTSMGPNGMNKMVINHLDKLFVTSDASTITGQLEVQHPAANLLVMAAHAQQNEIGDGTNFVLSFAGELLSKAEKLLRDGLHPTEIADGYSKAGSKALELLEALVIPGMAALDTKDAAAVSERIKGSIASKQYGYENVLASLVSDACIAVVPKNPVNFNVDNVRVVKIPGGTLHDSKVIRGLVLKRGAEGSITRVEDAKVVIFSQGIDTAVTETKGTVLIHNAEELMSYTRDEEQKVERAIKELSEAGVKVVVSGGSIGEIALHYIEKMGLMAVRIPSKFDLRRFARATGATSLVKLRKPEPNELGLARHLEVREIGGTECLILEQDSSLGQVSTIVLRGATDQLLDDIERAVDDGVNAYRVVAKDARVLPSGGAVEAELSHKISMLASREAGLDQYAIASFAEALEVVPRTIAENSSLPATDVVASLLAAHAAGNSMDGLDIETGKPRDLTKDGIFDLYSTKWWALKLAVDAAVTVLRIDQIIMARVAGGPRPPRGGHGDED